MKNYQTNSTDKLVASAQGISTATAHETSGKIGALPSNIKPNSKGLYICGRAFPVKSPSGHNLFMHHAIYSA